MSFVGFSAFVLSQLGRRRGLPFPIPALLAALTAVPLGVLIGLPALRVRGVSLAVVTLAVGGRHGRPRLQQRRLQRRPRRPQIGSPTFFGIDLGIAQGHDYPRVIFGVVVLVVVVLVGYGVAPPAHQLHGPVMWRSARTSGPPRSSGSSRAG